MGHCAFLVHLHELLVQILLEAVEAHFIRRILFAYTLVDTHMITKKERFNSCTAVSAYSNLHLLLPSRKAHAHINIY